MALGKLAEGEELGSNLLHVSQRTPANSGGRGAWQRRGQGRPVQAWARATSPLCPDCPKHQTFAADLGRSVSCPTNGLMRRAANGISNRQYFDRPGASLLCKFRSPKATHQRPFCSHT
jgi:hypothetical protein